MSMPRAFALLPLFTLLLAFSLPETAAASEARCAARKLGGLGRATAGILRCDARSAASGQEANAACWTKMSGRLSSAFTSAVAGGGCASEDEAGDVESALDQFRSDLDTLLRPVPGPDACAGAKLRATAKRVRREAVCRRAAAAAGQPFDPACATSAQQALADLFARREARGNCSTTDDAVAAENLAAAFLSGASDLIGNVLPGPAPTDLAAVLDGADIDLTWTAADPESGLTHSRVLRKLGAAPSGPQDGSATLLFFGVGSAVADDIRDLLPDVPAVPRTYHYAVYGCDITNACEQVGSHTTFTPTLVQALRAGGYVIHWRHASANVCADATHLGKADMTMVPDWWKSCNADCGTATARQLNATGYAESIALGDAFATLGITVGRVISSEFCRNVETAIYMDFGPTIEQSQELTFFVYDEAGRCAASFDMLEEVPAPGTNTALIGHSGNDCAPLSSLAWAEAAVYKPDGVGGTTFIQRVLVNDWLSLP